MTTVAAQKLTIQKSVTHDVVNSLLVLTVYHTKHTYKDGQGNPTNRMMYYMKFMNDTAYNSYSTEFERVVERLQEIIRSDNMFKTAILYLNLNRGKTVSGKENMEVAKFIFRTGRIDLVMDKKNPRITDDVFLFLEENTEELNKMLK